MKEIKRGKAELLPHQLEVVSDRETRIRVLQGGYRSGKTWTACASVVDMGFRSNGYPVLVVEPTYKMVKDVFVATMEKFLRTVKIPYRYHKTDHEFLIGKTKKFKVLCRSADQPRSLEGITAGAAVIDEWELCGATALTVAMARVSMGDCQQILLTGTPEGFGECYELILGKHDSKARLWTVSSRNNTFLRDDYVSGMAETMPDEAMVTEKLEGIRTAKSGRVYSRFDRKIHVVQKPKGGRIAIACDFNVRCMSWLICEVDDERRTIHVVQEVVKTGGTTTDEHADLTMRMIAKHLNRSTEEIYRMRPRAYCDASGSSLKTTSSKSDFHLLLQAGFVPDNPKTNPPVHDRINTVQCLFRDKRITIDPRCVTLVKSLETQAWDKNGEPEKRDNVDHLLDSLGYACHRNFPVHRPKANDAKEYHKAVEVDEWGAIW